MLNIAVENEYPENLSLFFLIISVHGEPRQYPEVSSNERKRIGFVHVKCPHFSSSGSRGRCQEGPPPPFILRLKTEGPKKNFSLETSPTPLISRSGSAAVLHEPSFAHTRKVYVSEFQVKN